MIVRNFNLHLNAGVSAPLVINVNQYDHYEQWVFTLYTEKGELFTPDTGAIIGVKSDGRAITNDATVNEDGQIVVSETEQMTAAPGNAMFELTINGGMHGTANFYLNVEPKPGENAVLSDSDLGLIQQAVEAAADIHGAAELMDEVTTLNRRVENLITTSAKTQEYVAPLSNSNWTVSGGKYTYSDYISFSEPVGNAEVIDAGWNVSSSGQPTEWRYEGVSAGYDGTDVYYTIVTDTDPRSDETTCYFRFVLWFPAETLGGTANEVVDIRVPASGMTVPTGGYSTAGDAVRGQISELKSQISTLSSIPTEIKRVMDTLFQNVAFKNDDVYTDELATFHAWATAVNLISISAVFDQGTNIVFSTDSLDDLKQYLTVTANFDDGSSAEVTNYTLSGSLTAGNCSITAVYEEKSTSFVVNVTGAEIITLDLANPSQITPNTGISVTDGSLRLYRTDVATTTYQGANYALPMADGYTYKITAQATRTLGKIMMGFRNTNGQMYVDCYTGAQTVDGEYSEEIAMIPSGNASYDGANTLNVSFFCNWSVKEKGDVTYSNIKLIKYLTPQGNG